MKQPRAILAAVLGVAAMAGALGLPRSTQAQATPDETRAMLALNQEIANQVALIADNQKQIDAKLAVIAENLRIARIYVSRGGGAPSK